MAKIKSKVKRTITIELSPREALALVRAYKVDPNSGATDAALVVKLFSCFPEKETLVNWCLPAESKEND